MIDKIFKNTTENIAENLKDKMSNDIKAQKSKHADTVIRNHVLFSMGFGLVPIPVVDIFAVSAMQLDMIRQLCKVYDKDFSETQGKANVSALTTATLARLGATSLAKLIPVVGSLVGGITNSIMAGASTYALGEVFKLHFESGGTFLDFDTNRLKKLYKEKFEKGKKVAQELQRQQDEKKKAMEEAAKTMIVEEEEKEIESKAQKNVLAKLKELGELKEKGIISEAEFDKMKAKLIEEF